MKSNEFAALQGLGALPCWGIAMLMVSRTFDLQSELVKKSSREARVSLGVSGKARESQYLGV